MRRMRIAFQNPVGLWILLAGLAWLAPQTAFGEVEKTVMEGTTVTVNAEESFDLTDVTEILWAHYPPDDRSLRLSDPGAAVCTFVTPIVTQDTDFKLRLTVTYSNETQASDIWTFTVKDNGITGYPSNYLPFYTANGHTMAIRVQPFGMEDGLVYLAPVAAESITETKNRPSSLPYGLIDLRIRLDKPGRATVAYFCLERDAYSWLKWCKWINGAWEFGPDNAHIDSDRIHVSLVLQDGGQGDDDGEANAMIVDPSGLGSPPAMETEQKDVSSGGCFLNSLIGK